MTDDYSTNLRLLGGVGCQADDEIKRLQKALSNIQWMLGGDLTDEALRNLRAYVDRQSPQAQPANEISSASEQPPEPES